MSKAKPTSVKGTPLFTNAELRKQAAALLDLASRRTDQNWSSNYDEKRALEAANLAEKVKRAQARPEEFVDALIVLVGKRGSSYLAFDDAFGKSTTPTVKKVVKECNTPENRRALYTILRALTEVPKSWAMSAFTRFLRGTGKQKKSSYHGAGTFGVNYGWKEREIAPIINLIAGGRSPYSDALMSYKDPKEDYYAAVDEAPDVELTEPGWSATRVERDVEFLNVMCAILEKRGLAPVPTPAAEKPRKERKVKLFKAGDIIRKGTLRDLTCPAHVRVTIEKQDPTSKQFIRDTVEWVVLEIRGPYAKAYRVKNGVAYPSDRYLSEEYKSSLIDAVYLGKWDGKVDTSRQVKYNFYYRRPQ
jgi:hypothetical protein